jgi:hypothetical protein
MGKARVSPQEFWHRAAAAANTLGGTAAGIIRHNSCAFKVTAGTSAAGGISLVGAARVSRAAASIGLVLAAAGILSSAWVVSIVLTIGGATIALVGYITGWSLVLSA